MSSQSLHFLPCFLLLLLLLLLSVQSSALDTDGLILLSFKFSILRDPQSVLATWNSYDQTPCSWRGVVCAAPPTPSSEYYPRVVGLNLPNSQLLGSIPANLGMIEHLQSLDLSNNSLNGSLPQSLFNATELRLLDLSYNLISGELPDAVSQLTNLQSLNLSDNALAGKLPTNLSSLPSLTIISLKNNHFSGGLPSGLESVQVLDLSSNLINGSLPSDFGGNSLSYLNVSHNGISGKIPPQFSEKIPGNAKTDLSFNNLTGELPESQVFLNQETGSFTGNPDLCGPPTKNPCPIPSSPSTSPNASSPNSPPAIAAIPRNPEAVSPMSANEHSQQSQTGLRPAAIVGIVAGDIAGIGILALIFLYIYRLKKKKKSTKAEITATLKKEANTNSTPVVNDWSSSSSESKGFTRWSCLRKRGEDEDSSNTTASDSEEHQTEQNPQRGHEIKRQQEQEQSKGGTLVTVDGEKELELETLLKASAYILGATGSSIMYKAVLEDGSSLAVRRIGEQSVDRFKDFENQIKLVAKLVHPNLVRIRGFYWGIDEKLIIYDFVPNGSLANARYRKVGSSPCHLPWEARLKIAKGVARGLAYLHEKKHVHGNLKPTNILLDADMEPRIGDFGLERLLSGDTSYKMGSSTRNFGSKRSTTSRDGFQDFGLGPSPGPSPSPSSMGTSPYHCPESLRSLKPNPKWDVYSFGVILLELLTGKVVVVDEAGQGLGLGGVDDSGKAFRMADMAIRGALEGKEEALLSLFRLGYNCASPVPQKRPTMKEALQVLGKFPSSPSSSYYYAP